MICPNCKGSGEVQEHNFDRSRKTFFRYCNVYILWWIWRGKRLQLKNPITAFM